jgi:hypothetical protein
MSPFPKAFVWYELMTTDVDAADALISCSDRLECAGLGSARHALHRYERRRKDGCRRHAAARGSPRGRRPAQLVRLHRD